MRAVRYHATRMPGSDDAVVRPRAGFASALATLIATGFGSGRSPLAPGTAGSAVGLLLFWPLAGLGSAPQLVVVGLVLLAGTAAADHVARRTGRKDPGLVVVDEIVGMWVSLLWLPFNPTTALVGFLAFRAMDIVKPYPARQLEGLRGGLGIMADDVMAGIYANLLLRVVGLVVPLA
jgi:phosphatidylglycerophosphatase A